MLFFRGVCGDVSECKQKRGLNSTLPLGSSPWSQSWPRCQHSFLLIQIKIQSLSWFYHDVRAMDCQRNSASNWRVFPPSCHRLQIFTLMPMQWPTSPNWVSPHIMRRTSLVTCNPSNLSFWSALDLLLFWWSQKIVRFRNHAASLAEHWHGSSAQQNWNYCTMSTQSTLWRVRWDQRYLITWLHVKKSR